MNEPAQADREGPVGHAQIGPYRVEATLGRGGMAEVFRVRDTRDDTVWALKILLPIADDLQALTRFRREFRALQRLSHPNVLAVREWGMLEGRPWFTMELVPGADLRQLVPAWADLDPADRSMRVLSVLVQTARALAHLHDRGLVHRDLSPANLMVREDGVLKLMDFGLVTDRDADRTTVGELMGTVAHLSPEQIRGDRVDGRADLYALGTVLYFMLTGRKPFLAHTPQGYLERHLHEVPRPAREIDPLVPELLDTVCQRLLQKDPANRFASATHLLHVLGDIEDDLAQTLPPRTVGRTALRARLRESLDEIAAGRRGAAFLVTGGLGVGKSRMLDLVEQAARRRGLLVGRGRCRPQDRPFGAFVPLWEALRSPEAPEVLRQLFDHPTTDLRVERYPVIAAFRDLVAAKAPCVILVDEVEKADGAVREMLDYLVRNTLELGGLPVLFVAAGEAEETARPPVLAGVKAVERHHLGPLARAEVEELVLSVVPTGPSAMALADRLYAETGGSPAYLLDMLRGLVDEGVLRRDGTRWALNVAADELSRSRLPLPASLRAALAERLLPLSPVAREVGRVVALARRSLDFDALIAAVGRDENSVADAVDALVDAGIVVERRADDTDRVELSHSRFRDLMVEDVPPETTRGQHRKLGEILERQHRYRLAPVVEDLAYHFEQAGLAPKAYAYLMLTARKHVARSSHEEGLHYLDRAARMEAAARPFMLLDEADRRFAGLHLERSRSLYLTGQWDAALKASDEASRIAEIVRDDALRSTCAAEQGKVRRNLGDMDGAEPRLQYALTCAAKADQRALRLQPLYELGAVRMARSDMTSAAACWQEALQLAEELGDRQAAARAETGLGIVAFCHGASNEARQRWEQAEEALTAEGLLEALTVTQVNLVELYKLTGQLSKAYKLVERTLAQAREVRHAHGVALGLIWRARLLAVVGRHDESRRNAQEALRIAVDLGTLEEQVLGLRTIAQNLLATGSARFALPGVEHLRELVGRSDVEGVAPHVAAMHARCLVARGDPEGAARTLEAIQLQGMFPHIEVRVGLEAAVAWRQLDRPDRAADAAHRVLLVAEAAGLRLYTMAAHQELAKVAATDPERREHGVRATAAARTIAASLGRPEADSFLRHGWGAGVR